MLKRSASLAPTTSSLASSLVLAVVLCAYGFMLACGAAVLFWAPQLYLHPQGETFNVDLSRNVTVVVRDSDTLNFFESYYGNIFFDTPAFLYLPFVFALYLRLGWRQLLVPAVASFAFYVVFAVARWQIGDSSKIVAALSLLVSAAFALALKLCVLPRDSRVPAQYMLQQLLVAVSVVWAQMLASLDAGDETSQLVLACVGYPVAREIFFYVARSSAKTQMLHADVAGVMSVDSKDLKPVARDKTWGFFLWVQIAMGIIVRLHFSKLRSTAMLVLVTLFQAVLEIFMRLTLPAREHMSLCKGRERTSALVVPKTAKTRAQRHHRFSLGGSFKFLRNSLARSGSSKGSRGSTKQLRVARTPEERKQSINTFISMLLVGECLSEYIAIWIATLILIIGHKPMLRMPLAYYNNMERPFDDPLDYVAVAKWAGLQIGSELIVDTLSCRFEMRAGYDLPHVWKHRHKGFVFVALAASTFASSASFFMLGFTDTYTLCQGMDVCYCADDNGLHKGGLVERYCMRLYPDNSGYPVPLNVTLNATLNSP